MLPYGQQEALAQVGFAQTIEPCRHAGPGYDQVFMCADGERLRVYSQRPFLSDHYIEIVPEGIVRVESRHQSRRSTDEAEGGQGRWMV